MDKYELKVSLDEIDSLISERRFSEAASVADTIDWTQVKGVHVLCRISDLYKINKRYKDSRDLMQMAYDRNPTGRKIIYSLCELELKLNNYIHALQLYNAFINVAPRDSDRYLLQYKLYKKQDVNVREQIFVLEEFLQHDFRERWAYELATLYLRAGEVQRCISQCDEIVTYFGEGRFVIRALELKQSLTPLTPQQEERLEILKNGGTIAPPVPAPEEADRAPETDGQDAAKDTAADPGRAPADTEEPGPDETDGRQAPQTGTNTANAGQPVQDKAGKPGPENADRTDGMSAGTEPVPESEAAEADGDAEPSGSPRVVIDARRAMPHAAGAAGTQTAGGQKDADAAAEDAEEDEAQATPEAYTDALLSDVKMEETIARGMREIGDYDDVLAQETSGQLAMVMEEDPPEEPQVEGQLDLAQIMSEWEKIRRDSEMERLAQARRRVMERSDAAMRELYGDDYASRGAESGPAAAEGAAGVHADAQGQAQDEAPGSDLPEAGDITEDTDAGRGSTRSWKREDVEKGLRRQRRR